MKKNIPDNQSSSYNLNSGSYKKLCKDRLVIADDFGDNDCTFTCGLEEGHLGEHKEEFTSGKGKVVVTWGNDGL